MRRTIIAISAAVASVIGAAPAGSAPSGTTSLSVRDSFRVGSGGTIFCTAQSLATDAGLTNMFDTGYALTCKDAALPVGKLYKLRSTSDVSARLAAARDSNVTCAAGQDGSVPDLGRVTQIECKLKDADVGYRVYQLHRGKLFYSVEGLAGLGGRILFGLAGDRFGAKRVLVLGLFAQALGAGAYFFVRQLGEFYAVAAVFGLIYGGIMPLYAVIAREYFPMRIMGTVLGASTIFSSGGMALGPAVGGWIYDTTGSYGWLYIASFGIGLGAMAIALLFPPFPSQRAAAQPA